MSLTAIIFLAGFAGALLLALTRSPRYGLYAYLAVFYLDPVSRWWGEDIPGLRWSLIAAGVTLLASLRGSPAAGRLPWTGSRGARLLVAMTLWLWVQNLWAISSSDHLEVSLLFTKYLVLFVLMYRLLDSAEAVFGFLAAHVAGCLYLGWLVLMAPDGGRLSGVGGPGIDEANALAMHLATGGFAAAALLAGGTRWMRVLALVAAPLILNGIVQTESRGAFLACVAGGLAFLAVGPARLRGRWIAVAVLAGIAVLPMVPATFWERMGTISAAADDPESVDGSTQTRLDLISAQWKMFLRYPLGSGHRGTAYLSPQYLREDQLTRSKTNPDAPGRRSSHNTTMTALSEQGVPGIVLYAACWLWALRSVRRLRGQWAAAADEPHQHLLACTAASLVIVLVAGQFTDYFKAEVLIWSVALLACLEALATGPLPSEATAPRPAPGALTARASLGGSK